MLSKQFIVLIVLQMILLIVELEVTANKRIINNNNNNHKIYIFYVRFNCVIVTKYCEETKLLVCTSVATPGGNTIQPKKGGTVTAIQQE